MNIPADQFQTLNNSLTGIKDTIRDFKESSRKNLKDVNDSVTEMATKLGEVKGRVSAMEDTLTTQGKLINDLHTSKVRHDETLKVLNMKVSKDSWTRIPILYLKSPTVKKLLTALAMGILISIGIASVLVLASLAGQEIVIKTP